MAIDPVAAPASRTNDEAEAELERLLASAWRNASPELRELLGPLVEAARRAGGRALFAVLDAEGDVRPCGQGCGWEGPWSVDSTLWPADRERLLGAGYRAPAQLAEAEELDRLRPTRR